MTPSPTLLSIAEAAINRYLALDPEMSAKLGELEGRCIGFEIRDPDIVVYCRPHDKAISLHAECEQPDSVIKGSLFNLLKMLRSDDPAQSLSRGEIEIAGDSRIAQRFSDILKRIDIDWEELLSKLTGDFAAHRVGHALRTAKGWLADTLEAARLDIGDYLREESGILPTRTEIDYFMQRVDEFRNDVDRLEARIKRLKKGLSGAGDS